MPFFRHGSRLASPADGNGCLQRIDRRFSQSRTRFLSLHRNVFGQLPAAGYERVESMARPAPAARGQLQHLQHVGLPLFFSGKFQIGPHFANLSGWHDAGFYGGPAGRGEGDRPAGLHRRPLGWRLYFLSAVRRCPQRHRAVAHWTDQTGFAGQCRRDTGRHWPTGATHRSA